MYVCVCVRVCVCACMCVGSFTLRMIQTLTLYVSTAVGEGDKKRGKPSDYIWVNPSIRLAAMDDGTKGEAATSDRGLQTEQPPSLKSSIFNRLGSPVGKEQQGSSLKLPPEAKQKYSPRFQVSIQMILNITHLENDLRMKMKNTFLARKTGNKGTMILMRTVNKMWYTVGM